MPELLFLRRLCQIVVQTGFLLVLGYLKGTISQGLIIRPVSNLQLHAYIDASFGLHHDSKLHTGVVIMVDESVVYVASRKQKCVTKSPTEAELVGLTDNLGLVVLFHEFVTFLAGKRVPLPLVYQDSTSVVTLVTQGGRYALNPFVKLLNLLFNRLVKLNYELKALKKNNNKPVVVHPSFSFSTAFTCHKISKRSPTCR